MDNSIKPVDWMDDPISCLDTSTLKGYPHIMDVPGYGIHPLRYYISLGELS
jgi:hypothetical protein